jgi:hypothetical protein
LKAKKQKAAVGEENNSKYNLAAGENWRGRELGAVFRGVWNFVRAENFHSQIPANPVLKY